MPAGKRFAWRKLEKQDRSSCNRIMRPLALILLTISPKVSPDHRTLFEPIRRLLPQNSKNSFCNAPNRSPPCRLKIRPSIPLAVRGERRNSPLIFQQVVAMSFCLPHPSEAAPARSLPGRTGHSVASAHRRHALCSNRLGRLSSGLMPSRPATMSATSRSARASQPATVFVEHGIFA